MQFAYNLFIQFYFIGISIAQFFNPKAKKWIVGRQNTFENLRNFASENPNNIWVHCASVGEFEQGVPLINQLENNYPNHKILISFFSPSGYEYAKEKHPNLSIIYLPIDTKRNAKKWYSILKPKAIFFIKYEFWHHFILHAKKNQTPLFIVSAIFWKELFFFKKYGGFFRKSLHNVQHFFVQNQESKKLLEEIGLKNCTITGDTRFERVIQLKNTDYENKQIEEFQGGSPIFMAGSIWDGDIEILKKIINILPKNYKIILAPHEPNNFDYARFSEYSTCFYSKKVLAGSKIMYIDTIGILSKIYRYANLIYVGGGFGKGIHNVLEPAVYNLPVLIGPNYSRFEEAKKLKEIGLLQIISSGESVKGVINDSLSITPETFKNNEVFFEENANVSEQILVFIKKQGILD